MHSRREADHVAGTERMLLSRECLDHIDFALKQEDRLVAARARVRRDHRARRVHVTSGDSLPGPPDTAHRCARRAALPIAIELACDEWALLRLGEMRFLPCGRIVADVCDQKIPRRILGRVRAVEDAPVFFEVRCIELPKHLEVLRTTDDRPRADSMALAHAFDGERSSPFENDRHLVSERGRVGRADRTVARDTGAVRTAAPEAGLQIAGRPERTDDRDLAADLTSEIRLVPLERYPGVHRQILRSTVHDVSLGGL